MDWGRARDDRAIERVERLGALSDRMLAESEAVAARLRELLDSVERVKQALDSELEPTPISSASTAPKRSLQTDRFRTDGPPPPNGSGPDPPDPAQGWVTYPGDEARPRGRSLRLGGQFMADPPAAGKTS